MCKHMTKEEKIEGWIVREPVLGHFLTFFRKKPVCVRSNRWVDADGRGGSVLGDSGNRLFDWIDTEDGAVRVELTIKVLD